MKAELVKRQDRWDLYGEDGSKIASSAPNPFKRLSIKNCEEIENGYDLDELAIERYGNDPNLFGGQRDGFKEGLQKALEILGDKKFSEDDVISMIEKSRKSGLTAEYIILTKQQTEWDVEIVIGTNYRHIECVDMGHLVKSKIVKDNEAHMLDKDGCLILKRL